MVLSIFGGFIFLGAVAFSEWRKNGRRCPSWHWIAFTISILAIATLIALWVGEYRFESAQRPKISN